MHLLQGVLLGPLTTDKLQGGRPTCHSKELLGERRMLDQRASYTSTRLKPNDADRQRRRHRRQLEGGPRASLARVAGSDGLQDGVQLPQAAGRAGKPNLGRNATREYCKKTDIWRMTQTDGVLGWAGGHENGAAGASWKQAQSGHGMQWEREGKDAVGRAAGSRTGSKERYYVASFGTGSCRKLRRMHNTDKWQAA